MMMTALSDETLLEVFSHAENEYPAECCGLIFRDGRVHRAKNIQSQLHRLDPALYPRTAADGYTLSISDALLLERSFSSDIPVGVIYHSHPDVGAYFSAEDRDKALFRGGQIYPVSYLVIDVRKGESIGAALFVFRDGEFVMVRDYQSCSTALG